MDGKWCADVVMKIYKNNLKYCERYFLISMITYDSVKVIFFYMEKYCSVYERVNDSISLNQTFVNILLWKLLFCLKGNRAVCQIEWTFVIIMMVIWHLTECKQSQHNPQNVNPVKRFFFCYLNLYQNSFPLKIAIWFEKNMEKLYFPNAI